MMVKEKFIEYVAPTPNNGFRAILLSKKFMVFYCFLLLVANIFFGNFGITRAYAQVSESALLQLHNTERAKAGLPPLEYNFILANSASAKGEAMLETNCWSHYCPEGKSPWEFFNEAGYSYSYAGENLAEGFATSSAAIAAWMNSPTHRENILKNEFSQVGFGIIYGNFQGIRNNIIVVAHFGTPRGQPDTTLTTGTLSPEENSSFAITKPMSGSFTNNPVQTIEGRSLELVNLAINQNNFGQIIPSGGIFSFNPEVPLPEGENVVRASQPVSGRSLENKFTLDTVPPALNAEQTAVIESNDDLVVKIDSNETLSSALVNIGSEQYRAVYESESNWRVEINYATLLANVTPSDILGSQIQLTDLAGNTTIEKVPENTTAQILNLYESKMSGTNLIRIFFKDIDTKVASITQIQWLAIFVCMFLILLMIVDIIVIRYYRNKYGWKIKSRSHTNVPTFICLLIVAISGNINAGV